MYTFQHPLRLPYPFLLREQHFHSILIGMTRIVELSSALTYQRKATQWGIARVTHSMAGMERLPSKCNPLKSTDYLFKTVIGKVICWNTQTQ